MAKKLTTRLSKGKVLTHTEMDENFELLSEVQSGNSKAIETALLNLQLEVATLKTENSILRQQVNTNNNAILINAQEISTIGQHVNSLDLDNTLPASTFNPEAISNIAEKENTLSQNEVTAVINTVTETNEETQEETTYQEVEYVPVVSPITPQEQISIPTVSDSEDETDDIAPTTQFDYVQEAKYLRNEVSRIRHKLGVRTYSMLMNDINFRAPTAAELHKRHVDEYLSAKASYDFWTKREYDWDNQTGEFQQIDTYPYRYLPSNQVNYVSDRNEISYPWKYASYPPTFIDINANDNNLTNYIGVRKASTRITNSLTSEHVNDIPVGVLFAQQYSKYMYGMWDESSELSVLVNREIQAYNALAVLDIWDDIKSLIQSSNIIGLFAWMNPIKYTNGVSQIYNNLITNTDHIDLLLEWANAKLEILNLATKKPNFTTEFTWDILSTYAHGLFVNYPIYTINTGRVSILISEHSQAPSEYSVSAPGTNAHYGYLSKFRQTYGSSNFETGTGTTFSKMNRLFMDGTTYDSWNSMVSNSTLYSEENPQFSRDTSSIFGNSVVLGSGSLGE